MEGSISVNQDIEVVLQKVQTTLPNYRTLNKISLTIITAEGKQISFSRAVLYRTISFQDQIVHIPNCNAFTIRLDKQTSANGQRTTLGSFEINTKVLRASNKLKEKQSVELPQASCTVFYQINLKNSKPISQANTSEPTTPAQDPSKTQETLDASENLGFEERQSPNPKSTQQSVSFSAQEPSFKISENLSPIQETNSKSIEARPEGKSQKSGTITERYDDQLEEEVHQIRPTARIVKVSSLQRSTSMNVAYKRFSQEKPDVPQTERVVKIRKPLGRKIKHLTQLQDQLQNLRYLKYLSLNKTQIQSRLSAKSLKMTSEFDQLEKMKQEKLKQRKQQEAKALKRKIPMIVAAVTGLIVSALF